MTAAPLFLIGIMLVIQCIFFELTWVVSIVLRNAGVVDVAWALGFTLSTIVYACLTHHSDVRHWTIGLMVAIWSLRLAWHLGVRFIRTYPKEDPRYAAMKESLSGNVQVRMLFIFLWQAAVLTLLTAPIAITLSDPQKGLGVFQFLAMVYGCCPYLVRLLPITN